MAALIYIHKNKFMEELSKLFSVICYIEKMFLFYVIFKLKRPNLAS